MTRTLPSQLVTGELEKDIYGMYKRYYPSLARLYFCGTLYRNTGIRRDAEPIFYPPALSFIKLRRLPVDKLAQNLVTVLVTVVF
jgi:hypothetical protein